MRAATLDYKDLTPWAANLKKGVSGELSKQFDVAVPAMQQILTPIRMSTTATLVSSKTTDVAGDIYRVTAVVDVTTDLGLQCAAPTQACGGACVDLASDAAHCGTCGRACASLRSRMRALC